MLILLKNNQIIGIDQNSLKETNVNNLSDLSDLINTLQLQINAISGETININNIEYVVNEVIFVSTDNIKVFQLSESNDQTINNNISQISEYAEKTDTFIEDNKIKFEDNINLNLNNHVTEEENITSEDYLHTNDKTLNVDLITKEKMEEESLNTDISDDNEIPKLNTDEDELLMIPQVTPEETKNELNVEINIPKESTETINVEKNEKLIEIEDETIEFEESQLNKVQTDILSNDQENEIEISFEDDLEEIKQIISLNKKDFNTAITNELKKASEELGIDFKELSNWHNQLIEQIKNEKSHIYKYLNKKDYKNLHESYHKLKGAALNLRLSKIALVLKKLDELSKAKEDIDKIRQITDDFYSLIENESTVIKEESQTQKSNENNNVKPDKFVENIILQTIQTYLKTQNESQFQKDKKYIEKILNTKIDSIEDLQNLIKGMQ